MDEALELYHTPFLVELIQIQWFLPSLVLLIMKHEKNSLKTESFGVSIGPDELGPSRPICANVDNKEK